MDQQLLQRTRYLLQTRFRHLRTATLGNFELVCGQVLDWLENHPILSSILKHLDNVPGEHHQEVKRMLESSDLSGARYFYLIEQHSRGQQIEPSFVGYTPTTVEQHASACLQILRAILQKHDLDFYEALAVYLTQEQYELRSRDNKNALEAIKDHAIRDLYEYLDESLDGLNAVNGLLRKYKQHVEWFQRERLQEILKEGYGGKEGERALARHLQQYIFDQQEVWPGIRADYLKLEGLGKTGRLAR